MTDLVAKEIVTSSWSQVLKGGMKIMQIMKVQKNTQNLEHGIEELEAKKEDITKRMQANKLNEDVHVASRWLQGVDNAITQSKDAVKKAKEEPKTLKDRYKRGDKVLKCLKSVDSLKGMEFENTSAQDIEHQDRMPMEKNFAGRDRFDKFFKEIMEQDHEIVGIYGARGIGKSTLLRYLSNKFSEHFAVILFISNPCTTAEIQDQIARKLQLSDDPGWEQKTRTERCPLIWRALQRSNVAILFDNLREKIELPEIGIGFNKRMKVVFTTTKWETCFDMEADMSIILDPLNEDQSWELLKLKANFKNSDPAIEAQARKVALKCRGLPKLLTMVGRTMRMSKDDREWYLAAKAMECAWGKSVSVTTRALLEESRAERRKLEDKDDESEKLYDQLCRIGGFDLFYKEEEKIANASASSSTSSKLKEPIKDFIDFENKRN